PKITIAQGGTRLSKRSGSWNGFASVICPNNNIEATDNVDSGINDVQEKDYRCSKRSDVHREDTRGSQACGNRGGICKDFGRCAETRQRISGGGYCRFECIRYSPAG